MGKGIILLLVLSTFYAFSSEAEVGTATFKFSKDVNGDGEKELIVHDLYNGNAAYGQIRIYDQEKRLIFIKDTQGEPYLWHPEKHIPALNPGFFPDLNNDGVKEIVIGCRGMCLHESNPHACVDMPWWFDVYKWNGKTYVLADKEFSAFFKEQLNFYKTFVKEKGDCEVVRGFINRAERLIISAHN